VKKSDVVRAILPLHLRKEPAQAQGLAFAPTNIALVKYWGKRNTELNLAYTSSLSIALPDQGALTKVNLHEGKQDQVVLNGNEIANNTEFFKRIAEFLNLFRFQSAWHFNIDIQMNIPVAAGLASSACGFASLTLALKDLFAWPLRFQELSILARLGSGSAARSLWQGFVEWHSGASADGMDSYAEPLTATWPSLCVAILAFSDQAKPISSREAMQATVNSSALYQCWVQKATHDLALLKQAIHNQQFPLFGGTAESNALNMHATMLSSWPPICYFLPATLAAMHEIWSLRQQGLELYFTEDAGPNLKLLFLEKDASAVKQHFPQIEVLRVFE
jgi:diphosphomevalonate decarboxylase